MPYDEIVRDGFTSSFGRFYAKGRVERLDSATLKAVFQQPVARTKANQYLHKYPPKVFVSAQLQHYNVEFNPAELTAHGFKPLQNAIEAGHCDKVPEHLEKLQSEMHDEWLKQLSKDEIADKPEWIIEKYFVDSFGRPDWTKTARDAVVSFPYPRSNNGSYRAWKIREAAAKVGLHQDTNFTDSTQIIYLGWDTDAVKQAAKSDPDQGQVTTESDQAKSDKGKSDQAKPETKKAHSHQAKTNAREKEQTVNRPQYLDGTRQAYFAAISQRKAGLTRPSIVNTHTSNKNKASLAYILNEPEPAAPSTPKPALSAPSIVGQYINQPRPAPSTPSLVKKYTNQRKASLTGPSVTSTFNTVPGAPSIVNTANPVASAPYIVGRYANQPNVGLAGPSIAKTPNQVKSGVVGPSVVSMPKLAPNTPAIVGRYTNYSKPGLTGSSIPNTPSQLKLGLPKLGLFRPPISNTRNQPDPGLAGPSIANQPQPAPSAPSIVGRYAIRCGHLKGTFPSLTKNMTMDLRTTHTPGVYKVYFDFGITKGTITVAWNNSRFDQYFLAELTRAQNQQVVNNNLNNNHAVHIKEEDPETDDEYIPSDWAELVPDDDVFIKQEPESDNDETPYLPTPSKRHASPAPPVPSNNNNQHQQPPTKKPKPATTTITAATPAMVATEEDPGPLPPRLYSRGKAIHPPTPPELEKFKNITVERVSIMFDEDQQDLSSFKGKVDILTAGLPVTLTVWGKKVDGRL